MHRPGLPTDFDDPQLAASARRIEDSLFADSWAVIQGLAAIAFLVLPVWLVLGVAQSWQRSADAREWQVAPAQVIVASDEVVALAYEVAGQRHVTSELTVAVWGVDKGSDWRRQHVRALSHAQSQGRTATVFADPRHPARAVFVRDFPLAAFSGFIAYAIVGAIFGPLFARNASRLFRGFRAGSGERIAPLSSNEQLVRTWILCAIWNAVAFLWAQEMLQERAGATPCREALWAGQALGVLFGGWLAVQTARRAMDILKGEG